MLIAQAEKYDVPVRTTDPAELFDDADLREFLVAFEAAPQVLRTAGELAQVADDGVLVAGHPLRRGRRHRARLAVAGGDGGPGPVRGGVPLAKRLGMRTTGHAGETPFAGPDDVRAAIDVLGVDRIDHGYRVVDAMLA